jgi:hypothetical protein
MPSILGKAVTNSFDPSVALGNIRDWFLQLLTSQVVISGLGEIVAFAYSCGAFLHLPFFCMDHPGLKPSLHNPYPPPRGKKKVRTKLL